MKNYIQKSKVQIGFALAGAIGGFLYWKFVGCLSGTCPIRSVWYWTTLWGTAVGYLTGDFINDILIKRKRKRRKIVEGKFQSIINSKRPVLVDFYADWCGPCKQVPPILKEVKDDFRNKVRILKVNVDRNPFIASKYQIKSIPTLIIFQNGTPKWTGVGIRHANELKEIIKHICE